MDANQLLSVSDTLDTFLSPFLPIFGRPENKRTLGVYCRGRLGPLERKSLEPIALAEGLSPRVLQLFLDDRIWSEEAALDLHQAHVAARWGSDEGIFIVDDTSDAKKGRETCGVARQYCGESGKVDNCIVSAHLAYAGAGDSHVLLDGELRLPESWDATAGPEAVGRRQRTGVPDDIGHRTSLAVSLDQIRRALKNGVPGRWVTGDEVYGRSWQWREGVAAMGLSYVAEVPRNTRGWIEPPIFAVPSNKPTQGRRFKLPRPNIASCTVEELAVKLWLAPERWRVHEGTKGPDVWEVARSPFCIASKSRPGQIQEGILLICRNPLEGGYKYFVSNAPPETTTRELLRVAFSRWRVERCFEDAKGELGLNHAETRSWKSIRRHLILTCILHLFLTQTREAWGGKYGRAHNPEPAGRRR